MEIVTSEKANYVIAHYANLLSEHEMLALKHYRHLLKLAELPDSASRTEIYLRGKWLSNDMEVLKLLDDGYLQFISTCTKRILEDSPENVFFNLCLKCGRLAKTPQAKQCRFCGYDWH